MGKTLHMMIGSIGTGKSAQSDKMSEELQIEVLSADTIEKASTSIDDNEIEIDIMEDYLDHLDSGESFILDGLNINKVTRKLNLTLAQQRGYIIKGYDFGPGDDNSLKQRLSDPRGVSASRWTAIAESNKISYEKPELNEGFEEIFEMI
jgi:predicted kinase